MKNPKNGIAERLGKSINQLDIDFSRLTGTGWIVSFLSFGVGGGVAYFAFRKMVKQNGLDLGAGLTFGFTMIGVTTVVFLLLRWCTRSLGLSITKSNISDSGQR